MRKVFRVQGDPEKIQLGFDSPLYRLKLRLVVFGFIYEPVHATLNSAQSFRFLGLTARVDDAEAPLFDEVGGSRRRMKAVEEIKGVQVMRLPDATLIRE